MKLSRREREVAGLVAEGLTNRDIAKRLFVAERTAEYHVEQIRNKLGFRNRSQIAAWVRSNPEEPAIPERRHNVPQQLTSFVGREREIAEVVKLLDENRLVTITGPTGIGKTRLAQEVASQVLSRFDDGVWLVPLAELSDARLLPEVLATSVEIRDLSDLRTRRVLIVLDSCEVGIDALAALTDALLRESPGVRILATSQEPLRAVGEVVWRLGPMAEAEALFRERAALVRPSVADSADISEVCDLLDRVPLAVELAASRLDIVSPEELRAGLATRVALSAGTRTGDPRHRSLRAALDWTYELLTPREQLMFRRLSVFAGGFRLESAVAVCSDGLPNADELILSLAEKSLLSPASDLDQRTRYRMLEATRRYSLERLEQSGELAGLQRLHFEHMLALVQASAVDAAGPGREKELDRVGIEIENMREALEWSRANERDGFLRLVNAVAFFWHTRRTLVEARAWLDAALSVSTVGGKLRADVLWQAAIVSFLQGDTKRGDLYNREAREIYAEIGDWSQLARVLNNMAVATKDAAKRIDLLEQALESARKADDPGALGLVLSGLAVLAGEEGDHKRAMELANESLALRRATGHKWAVARSLLQVAQLAMDRGEVEVARPAIREALELVRALGDQAGVAISALVAARFSNDPGTGLRLAAAANAILETVGAHFREPWAVPIDEQVPEWRKLVGLQAAAIEAEGRAMSVDDAVRLTEEVIESSRS